MASAQAMEEELQQSVLLSEDAEYETADTAGDDAEISRASESKTNSSGGTTGEELGEDEEDLSDRDASGEEIDVDAEGEEEGDLINNQIVVGHFQHVQTEDGDGDGDGDEDEDEDEDEEDDEVSPEPGGHDVDDEEAVGAVKIKPGASADSDDEDMDSEVSDLPSAPEESDEEPAWEAEEADEEDESETGPTHKCMFCKQDEEDDPSEDFEAFLACNGCEKNAHQQCARDAAAMSEHNVAQSWACPDCNASDSELDIGEPDGEGASLDGDAQPESQLLEDSLTTEQDKIHVDTKPSFDKPVLDTESASGAQSPGKRKSSSVEPNEVTSSLRKRRRNIPDDIISANEEGLHTRQSAEPARTTSRALRLKVSRPPPVVVEKRSRNSLVLKIQVRPGNLKEILSRRRRDRRRPATSNIPPPTPMATPNARPNNNVVITPVPVPVPVPTPAPAPASILATPFTTDVYSQPFYSFFDKETEDMKGKPYGGILTETEADTSKTLPQPEDRRRFDEAKQRAEDEWRARVLAMQAEADVPIRKSRKPNDNASQIECIEFGGWEIDTWYAAPYPAEYSRNRVLYICEFCLKYMNSDYVAWRHKLKCATKHPPGDEIYRHGSVSMFEVDGRKNPVYCQNLCLLAKLFLGSKTLYYDVEPFLFYVLCEYDDCGYHFVGYFSKEKRASSQNNVSCILTLPIHQRKGYGNLLIDFSYLLTKVEEKTGSPEKPLSDMGLVSYRNYWRLRLCQYFLDVIGNDDHKKDGLSIKQISDDTGMTPDDVIAALEGLRALVRDPQTKLYAFRIDVEYCRQYVAKWEAKGYVQLRAKSLAWTPYLMGRSNAVNFELGPPITAIAPREDDETKVLQVHVEAVPGQMTITEEIKAAISFQTEASVASETKNASGDSASEPVMSIEKVAPEDRENAEPQDIMMLDVEPESPIWAKPYRNIPPSRFEIFPPVGGSRRSDRSRQSGARSAVSRAGSGSSRPRPKRSGGSSRRPTASRPRNNTSRRKTGGTGRGPGRWPKGTKKADYGNAASGPGMPPGWDGKTMCDAELLGDAGQGSEVAPGVEEQIQDEVQVCVARPATNGYQEDDHSGAELEVSDAESDEEIDDHNDGTSQADDDVDAEGEDE